MDDEAVDWLLAADASIRWQAMLDLTDATADEVEAERARVATEGWGAALLARRRADGIWSTGSPNTDEISVLALLMLRDMGLDPTSDVAREMTQRVRENLVWHNPWGEWNEKPVFDGEIEPCINGRIVAAGAYFGIDVAPIVERLLGEQMADGGWNCEQENGSIRGSFNSTINVLEGLAEFAQSVGGPPDVTSALWRGEEYLLERRLLRRLSTGEVINSAFIQFSYPTGYHYDLLRGLDFMRAAGVKPDTRATEAIELVRSKRGDDGKWVRENVHEKEFVSARVADLDFDMDEREGEPSHWNTLRALRVLSWWERSKQ